MRACKLGVTLVSALLLFSGCATVPKDTDTVTLTGKVLERRDVASAPQWSINEDYTRGMLGLVGVVIAEMRGTPKHYVYRVSSGQGDDWSIQSKLDFALGSCIDIVVPRVHSEKNGWLLDEVELRQAAECR